MFSSAERNANDGTTRMAVRYCCSRQPNEIGKRGKAIEHWNRDAECRPNSETIDELTNHIQPTITGPT